MERSIEDIATDWITYSRYSKPSEAPDEIQERGWALYELTQQQPELAWEVIKDIVSRHTEGELFSETETEAQRIVGNLAAGPLEDLLATHGPNLVDSIETEARRDRRMSWALGCVWENTMTDDVWARVQRAAGAISR